MLDNLAWWQIMAISMYKNGKDKRYNYKEWEALEEIEEAIKNKLKGKSTALRTQMRTHPDYFGCIKGRKGRNLILDKWFLLPDGIKYVEKNLFSYL